MTPGLAPAHTGVGELHTGTETPTLVSEGSALGRGGSYGCLKALYWDQGAHTGIYRAVCTSVYTSVHTSVYTGIHSGAYTSIHTAVCISAYTTVYTGA